LRRLYVDEGKTETEIAQLFDTYQVKVGRLRRSYGIPTIARTDRLGLPGALAPRLRSILVGSMLGDGGLRRTGPQTAGYVEHHSAKQKAYLDWKVEEWGPFVATTPSSDKGSYRGFRLITHGCRVLFPFWEMFYPEGDGNKTFTQLPLEWVDELALAVWFMDDGSRAADAFRFAVGPREEDQRVQLRVLRQFNLRGKLYGEDGDTALHVQGRTYTTRFIDAVRPHIHPSMAYKLKLKPRKAGVAPRHLLTPERLQPLVERGFSAQAIANVFKVSRNSVRRALDRMGVPKRPPGRPPRTHKELDVGSAELAIQRLDDGADSYIDDVLAILSRTDIPLPDHSDRKLARDIELIRKATTKVEGDALVRTSTGGSALCTQLFPYRWDARYRRHPSAREAWYTQKYLRRAIQFQVSVKDPVTPVRVFRAVQAVVRGPTNFRPCYAKAVVEMFSPAGGTVLDPCAGYGGRAVGALVAGRRYVGVEPHPEAPEAFRGLLRALGGHLELHNEPFEDVGLGDLRADLVLTSPPYFCVERYADDATQSWVRYPTWEAWVEGFLRVLVNKSRAHLRPGGRFCVNTKDVRVRGRSYPIAGKLAQLAEEAGFKLEATLKLPLGRIGKKINSEPLFVFR
jgi:hypothetical protein